MREAPGSVPSVYAEKAYMWPSILAALIWISSDNHQPVQRVHFILCSHKPIISGASFPVNRLTPVFRCRCTLEVSSFVHGVHKPLPANTLRHYKTAQWLLLKIVMDACQKRIVVNRHGVPSPEDGGEWEQV